MFLLRTKPKNRETNEELRVRDDLSVIPVQEGSLAAATFLRFPELPAPNSS
jgi:hypothetical protein